MACILVADDHPLNRYFVTTLLSYYGHEVVEAADGFEALDLARRRRPDLIIADVAMPRMDGAELTRAIRADPELAGVPVVFYTASYREVESRAIADAAGVEHVISKPSDPEVLLDTVRRALGPKARPVQPTSFDRTREYIGRLQLASIRMSAIIELTAHLSEERDPQELLRTACRAVRKIFGAGGAVIAAQADVIHDGEIATNELPDVVSQVVPLLSAEPVRASGASEPLVTAVRAAMPQAWHALLLPMAGGGRRMGWMLLAARGDAPPFSTDDERLALATSSQIAAAYASLGAANAERRRLEAESRAEERMRLARELHDGIGQLLTAMRLEASRLPTPAAQALLPLIESATETIVRVISELRPSGIAEIGLNLAIEKKLAELQRRTGIEGEADIHLPAEPLPEELAVAVFRIVEEAVSNVARHSRASRIKVDLTTESGELILRVEDNGRGIRMHEWSASDAYGLIGIRERSAALGGSCEIRGEEGRGTTVVARFPIERDPRVHRR